MESSLGCDSRVNDRAVTLFLFPPANMGSTTNSVGEDPRLYAAATMTTSVKDPYTLKAMTVRLIRLLGLDSGSWISFHSSVQPCSLIMAVAS
jgi:hypothetical protein